MFRDFLFVMLGGALGAALRYATALLTSGIRLLTLPVGTLVVNLLGCILLGLLTGIAERHGAAAGGFLPGLSRDHAMLLLTTGLCGAFTTFSTFSAETIKALEGGHPLAALLYVAFSITAGLLLFWGAKTLAVGI